MPPFFVAEKCTEAQYENSACDRQRAFHKATNGARTAMGPFYYCTEGPVTVTVVLATTSQSVP